MKKILVPTDFSEESEYAVRFASELAEKYQAQLILLHAIDFEYFYEFPYFGRPHIEKLLSELRVSLDRRMEKFIRKHASEVDAKGRITTNYLIKEITEIVQKEKIDAVILGAKGSSGWEELFMGSNTEKIVRHTPCQVIAVPGERSIKSIKKILVPIDLKEINEEFLHQIGHVQNIFSSSIEFLWIRTFGSAKQNEAVTKEFSEFIKKLGIRNYAFSIIENIHPSDGILMRVYDTDADMIAMATHARKGISHWISGSLTEATLSHVDVPIWTFRLDKKAKKIKLESLAAASPASDSQNIKVSLR